MRNRIAVVAVLLVMALAGCGSAGQNPDEKWAKVQAFDTLNLYVNGNFTEVEVERAESLSQANEWTFFSNGEIHQYTHGKEPDVQIIEGNEPWGVNELPAANGMLPDFTITQREPLITAQNYKVYGGWEPVEDGLWGLDRTNPWVDYTLVYGDEYAVLRYKFDSFLDDPRLMSPNGKTKELKLQAEDAQDISLEIFNAAFKVEETSDTSPEGDPASPPLVSLQVNGKTPIQEIIAAKPGGELPQEVQVSGDVIVTSYGERPTQNSAGEIDPVLALAGMNSTYVAGQELFNRGWAPVASVEGLGVVYAGVENLTSSQTWMEQPFVYYLANDSEQTFTRFEIQIPSALSESEITAITKDSRSSNAYAAQLLNAVVDYQPTQRNF